MSKLHQSYRYEREANERWAEQDAQERKEHARRDTMRHVAWFNKSSGQNLTVDDFSDGLAVGRFVNCQLPNQGSNLSREEKIQNNKELLAHLQACDVKLVGIQADDLADANLTILSGLLWVIRQHKDVMNRQFVPDPNAAAPQPSGGGSADSTEVANLRALYTAGFIGDEEYKRRLTELGGGDSDEPPHDSFKCTCPSTQCPNCTKSVKECCEHDHKEMCTHGTIVCPICEEKLERAVYAVHLGKCRVAHSNTPDVFDSFECLWCNENMSVAYKEDHDIICLDKARECPMKQWGCNAEVKRKDFFSHVMECRKLYTDVNMEATSTCEHCGAVLHYARAHEDAPDYQSAGLPYHHNTGDTPQEQKRMNDEDIGGHYCPKRFQCPLKAEGCDFTCQDRGKMIKHLEEECLNNDIICHFCDASMKRVESLTHKCCDFARAQVGVRNLEHAGVINNRFLEPKDP